MDERDEREFPTHPPHQPNLFDEAMFRAIAPNVNNISRDVLKKGSLARRRVIRSVVIIGAALVLIAVAVVVGGLLG